MSNRGKNFRRRSEEDNDESTTTVTAPTTTTTTKKPPQSAPKKPAAPKPKLLSFADEEGGEESPFTRPSKPKKSSSSSSFLSKSSTHKITSMKERISSSASTYTSSSSNVQPQAGEYTKERLLELQKNTRTIGSSSRPPPPPSSEPKIVLKGLIKPIYEEDKKKNDNDKELDTMDVDDAETRLGSMGIGGEGDKDLIPDQATINAIRAKRERLRQSRAPAGDYISLDAGSNHGEAEGISDEEPEFQTRIALFGDKSSNVGVTKGVFEDGRKLIKEVPIDLRNGGELVEEIVDDEEDEDDKIWEEEQCRKGRGVSNSAVPVVVAAEKNLSQQQQQSYAYQGGEYQPRHNVSPGLNIGGSAGVMKKVLSIPQQATVASQAMRESLRRLKETHGRTMSALDRNDENMSAALSNIIDLENSLTHADEKFVFMQKLQDFVSVICDFLQHKAPYIEELEEQMQKLHEERAVAVLERRTADNADEMIEIEAPLSAAMLEHSKGGSTEAVINAAQLVSSKTREQTNLLVKLDELGRDMNLQKRMEVKRRAEARKRRKARSEAKRMSAVGNDFAYHHIEGESSTDESDSESTSYKSNREMLLQTSEQIFNDAEEEFSKLALVKEKFETWKKRFFSSYRDAYMPLSVPAIFSPYVRLELLKWDPLHEESDFYDMQWHSLLFDYGLPEHGGDVNPDDADANLVPGLVEKVALPILHHDIAHCWDMLSTKGTKNAVSATNLVISYVPASKALGDLISAIHSRLADAVANITVPTWSTVVIKAVPDAARIAAYRFGMAVRLLKNICLWKDILSIPSIEQLALDELLSGKVLPHLRSIKPNIHDAITRTERIVASLNGVWSGSSVTMERSYKLQPLVDYVLTLAKTLEKKHASGVSETETSGLARRLKKMLVDLNEYDKARAILRTFQLKEAL
ncbi:hypothetical protein C5167_001413 [Papaver somniferum]|uniref:GCF C-terminal domain-containing protein n=1 Tax=Papaver somniferum TaxID=3469 RepID=A0A4Y7KY01_PAPSO|nr:transcriptional repressor ILP1-like [Papaver somniferum]RZC77262.1 hypothetical protein C5167_001413 [Papaver somniferum]